MVLGKVDQFEGGKLGLFFLGGGGASPVHPPPCMVLIRNESPAIILPPNIP